MESFDLILIFVSNESLYGALIICKLFILVFISSIRSLFNRFGGLLSVAEITIELLIKIGSYLMLELINEASKDLFSLTRPTILYKSLKSGLDSSSY